MNGKQAKRLRRAAMGLAVALTESGKRIHQDGIEIKTHVKYGEASEDTFDSTVRTQEQMQEAIGRLDPRPEIISVQAVNRKDSLRGIYRTIKQGMASGNIPKEIKNDIKK